MKKLLLAVTLTLSGFILGWLGYKVFSSRQVNLAVSEPRPRPLDKYTIENLAKTEIPAGKINIKDKIKEGEKYTSYLFEFEFNSNLDGKTFKKTTGQINLPSRPEASGPEAKSFPIIVMFRGYVDQNIYTTGMGTKNSSAYFAQNGFVTIAPDFLGYAGSDSEAGNIFESRFQTYVTALSLLKTLEVLQSHPELISGSSPLTQLLTTHNSQLALWAHSNGGQIALTILEITGKSYPTTLWAPVSKPFPYSILYYTDESDDGGKLIRRELAKFEEDYDTDLYSLTKYLDRIYAPLAIHQGTSDDAVPFAWTDTLVTILKKQGNDVTYFKYPGADHNLTPGWDSAVERSLEFYKTYTNQEVKTD